MKGRNHLFIGLLVAAAAAHADAAVPAGPGFERYRVILNRQPFGMEPADPAPTAATAHAPPPGESFVKTIRLCRLTKDDATGVVQAGLFDAKTQFNYFMVVGDVEDGMELVEVDYENEKVLLRKGAEQYWLDMNSATAVASLPGNPASFSAPPAPGFRPAVTHPAAQPRAGVAVSEMRAKLKEAHEQARRERVEAAAQMGLTNKVLNAFLEEYQMELIRSKGEKGPPLPIPLTREMDDQLVKEGVLPPQE